VSALVTYGNNKQHSTVSALVTYGNNKQHSTVSAVVQRPGEVQRIRDPTLVADVLIYYFVFLYQFATWLRQIIQLLSSNIFIIRQAM